jgi:PAS domain S-box-containing protein
MSDELLHESMEELYEQAPCGFLFTRPDGTIVRANQTLLSWTGHERDDLLSGRRFQDLLTVPGKIFYENQYSPLLQMQGFVKGVAFDLARRDREPLPVLVDSIQRTGADGRPALTATIIVDATDRRAYERELLRSRRNAEQLAAVLSAASDAVLSATPAGEILTWNAGAMSLFGFTEREIVGKHLRAILCLGEDEAIWQEFMAELRAGRPVQREMIGHHATGRQVDISVGWTPHQGLLGELSRVSAIIRDIGARREIERLQREFLAMATHELRNPLAGIKGNAQLMQRRGAYNERAVDAIIAQANRLDQLVGDLLLASQIEADHLELLPEETDLVVEARAAADALGVAEAGIRVEASAEPILVRADRQRLGQVFANLLANAVKYSRDSVEIVVRVGRTEDEARVAFIDQGVGIPPEALPRLFDRFYRAPGAAERAAGLGLGLFISLRIVEAHGGQIEVESRPGHGSTFTVVLPLRGIQLG